MTQLRGGGTHALAKGNSLQRLVLWRGGEKKMFFEIQMLLWCSFLHAPKKKTHQAGRHPGIPAAEAGLLEEVLAQREAARSMQTL